jgi:hypothetical protein
MWAKCRSWGSWWKWIWLPFGATVVVAFVTANLMVTSARAAEASREAAEIAKTCTDWKEQVAELTQQHKNLIAEINAIPGVWLKFSDKRLPAPPPPNMHDWSESGSGPSATELYEYYVSHGGPTMKYQAKQLQTRYSESCLDTSDSES